MALPKVKDSLEIYSGWIERNLHHMNRFWMAALVGVVSLFHGATLSAQEVSHRLLAQDKGHAVILSAKGDVEWEAPCPFTSHDIAMLPNGNVLLHTGPAAIVEMSPDKKVVWEYHAQPKAPYNGPVEIHAFQRLKDGLTMIAETGN